MPDVTDSFEHRLRVFAGAELTKRGVPGASIGVARPGQPLVALGVGVDNARAPRDVTEHTLFQIGSNTKTYTALVVAILAERGELELDASVQRYCPTFTLPSEVDPAVAETVTVKMLLNHTPGWDGDALLTAHGAGGRNDDALAQLPAQMGTIAEMLTEPGTLHHYNNTGFSLAGSVIEAVTGKSWEQVIRDEIFAPLGLANSFFFAEECITYACAVGHGSGKTKAGWLLPRASFPAGAICCSVLDLLEYGRFWLGDGVPLLSSASFHAMLTPTISTDISFPVDDGAAVGLGWFLGTSAGRRNIHHGGGTNGQVSSFSIFPDDGTVD